ncbi:hypothetical protein ISF_03328 [Cordyceps fumosorosea ARSEF 2679]|uniref:Uncharacterized protein n=1 Tax=Cordyceps fumosorosea (strain ARSEF 2679) TaxID=1081104 RepID=A0A168AMQ8_CORFA|nr:hypothetical protein ISF_03328 [Cordyceps fumosorosea ARSEF 2679]OAA68953.1 hypothetical protein ISF_03328 [Cordyceps fumosorosea ARSEF 2679]
MKVDTALLLAAALVASPVSAIARNVIFNTNIFHNYFSDLLTNYLVSNFIDYLFNNLVHRHLQPLHHFIFFRCDTSLANFFDVAPSVALYQEPSHDKTENDREDGSSQTAVHAGLANQRHVDSRLQFNCNAYQNQHWQKFNIQHKRDFGHAATSAQSTFWLHTHQTSL